ncbi:hypothetical protein J2S10_004913 [Neobacillus ginsengisoli]|uniref:Transposase n=1 Tax=Neobacillus ginsengisoli TaxID=904295 RepID=A0ABT9Y234_9BACI|nr:hypothetical protein [Neobacillus ginsengisoli]
MISCMAVLTLGAIKHDTAGGQTPIFIWLLTEIKMVYGEKQMSFSFF